MGEFFLDKLVADLNAVPLVIGQRLNNVSKLKALFHHFAIEEIRAHRLLANNSKATVLPAEWHDANIREELYVFREMTFVVSFSSTPRAPDLFTITVTVSIS